MKAKALALALVLLFPLLLFGSVGGQATGYTLYDNFDDGAIDATKWSVTQGTALSWSVGETTELYASASGVGGAVSESTTFKLTADEGAHALYVSTLMQ